jgi:predicted esterase
MSVSNIDPLMPPTEIHLIPTLTHGRMLVQQPRAARSRGLLVGFHGYMENAAIQMQRLEEIPRASQWTLAAVQGLHRFYRGRSQDVVASWMTREDRETAIADNLAYVAAALESVPHDDSLPIVYLGFSQGVAMAYRAAVRGPAASVIAICGNVPPELRTGPPAGLSRVLVARGERDDWYTQSKFDADVESLTATGVPVEPFVYDGGHEWTPAVFAAAGEFLDRVAGRIQDRAGLSPP